MLRWWLTPGILLLAGLAHAEESALTDTTARLRAELDRAHASLRRGDYAAAEVAFRQIADQLDELNPTADEARFYEAESLRLQGRFPQAARVYVQALEEYPFGERRPQALELLYRLANYWLDDTREEIEQRQSGGWSLPLTAVLSWNPSKPFLTQEAEAMNLLQVVVFHDPVGPLAERALFLMGSVAFFRQDYSLAGDCFSRLMHEHPNSPLASLATIRAVVARRRELESVGSDGNKLTDLVRLTVEGLVEKRYVDEEDCQLLCRQLPWALWQSCRGLIPGCMHSLSTPLLDVWLTEFAPGSKYWQTFQTQDWPTACIRFIGSHGVDSANR